METEFILGVWKLVLLGFMYLFFLRVLRAVWANLRTSTTAAAAAPNTGTAAARASNDNKGINRLRVLEPAEQKGVQYELSTEITIGRAPGCKINLDDTFVSQLHARVFRKDGQVFLEDLGSTNGTLCNGKKVSGAIPLKKGDKIQVGKTIMEAAR